MIDLSEGEKTINTQMEYKLEQRIISLDVLRGIALLGILLMNIQSFAGPFSAYANPTAFGDFSDLNFWVWSFLHVFAEQKFMAIFSILFGAGVYIFYTKAIAKGLDAKALHQRRMKWLLVFGFIHAYLIWYGDILFSYAFCGLIVINFVEKPIKNLLIIAAGFLLVPVMLTVFFHFLAGFQGPQELAESMKYWAPNAEQLKIEIQSFKGSWLDARSFSATNAFILQSIGFLFYTLWRATALMLIGVVMMRTGFITARLVSSSYRFIAIVGLSLGVLLSSIGVQQNTAHGFDMQYSAYLGTLFNYVGSLASATGYIALVMLLVKSQAARVFQSWIANVGKMAFTNYIMQSVICTFVFYGFGLGYFVELNRAECLFVVALIWVLQLVYSTAWLSYFKQGPLEQFWRYLTYHGAS